MTTTLYVKARAHGAIVALSNVRPPSHPDQAAEVLDTHETKMGSWEEREIHLEENQVLSIRQGDPAMIAELEAERAPADEAAPLGDRPTEGLADDPSIVIVPAEQPLDADSDGHDDKTGQFVDGNESGKKRR